jgi:hypothetical protein
MTIVAGAILTKIYTKRGEFRLGQVVSDSAGNLYRFIKFNYGDGQTTAVAGHLIIGLDNGTAGDGNDFWEGTNDPNSAGATRAADVTVLQRAFGFCQAALTDGSYGFVQISGPNKQVILTDNAVAQNDLLMAHATTTGAVDTHDAAAKTVVGIALEADGTTAATQLDAGQVDIRISG